MKFHEEIAIKIFYRVFIQGRKNRDVAKDSDILMSEDTVGKYVKHIREERVKFIPNFPAVEMTSVKLSKRFNLKARVALSGDEPKNIGPIANEAVNIFLDAIENIPGRILNVAVGCGETMGFFADALYQRLHSDPAAQRLLLSKKTINLMPTAIIPGRRYNTTLPAFLVAQFYSRLCQALPRNYLEKYIHAYVPTLADSFRALPANQQKEYYNTTLKDDLDLMRTCNIILLGIGGVDDIHYRSIASNLDLKTHQMGYAQINYQPIDEKGSPVRTERQICGLSIRELSEIAKDNSRYVIAMAGGQKHRFIESVFAQGARLPFNHFVTDVHIANHLLTKFSQLNTNMMTPA